MFRVLVLLVLVSLGWVAVCGCVGGGAKPPSLPCRRKAPNLPRLASNLPADAAEGVFAAAIRGRRPVAFVYNGVSRVAHPHRLGASAAGNGKTLVRCVGGDARRRGDGDVEALRGGQGLRPAAPARRALRPRAGLHARRPRHPRADGGGGA